MPSTFFAEAESGEEVVARRRGDDIIDDGEEKANASFVRVISKRVSADFIMVKIVLF